jgi:hypothetical protein
MGIVEGEKVFLLALPLHHKRTDNQKPPALVMRMADGGHHCTDYLCEDHGIL